MIERPSARLILLDPQDRLFLFKVHQPTVYDPADPHYDPFWIMIGGLVDPGEEFAAAAVREAREETGLVVDRVRWVWSRQRVMQWRERQVMHRERFFLGWCLRRIAHPPKCLLHVAARDGLPVDGRPRIRRHRGLRRWRGWRGR